MRFPSVSTSYGPEIVVIAADHAEARCVAQEYENNKWLGRINWTGQICHPMTVDHARVLLRHIDEMVAAHQGRSKQTGV